MAEAGVRAQRSREEIFETGIFIDVAGEEFLILEFDWGESTLSWGGGHAGFIVIEDPVFERMGESGVITIKEVVLLRGGSL